MSTSVQTTFCDLVDELERHSLDGFALDYVVVPRHSHRGINSNRLLDAAMATKVQYSVPIIQPFASNTFTEAEQVHRILSYNSAERILIVTDRFHMYRAYLTYAKFFTTIYLLQCTPNEDWLDEDLLKVRKYSRYGHCMSFSKGIKHIKRTINEHLFNETSSQ